MPPPIFFFFNDTATTEIYTLSLHDALPISAIVLLFAAGPAGAGTIVAKLALTPGKLAVAASPAQAASGATVAVPDRKSTRLNSSHSQISYAVFCLKKKRPLRGSAPLPA